MSTGRTIGRYRLIDLGIWLAIMLVFESVAVRAAVRFTGQPYWVSVVPAISAIVFMRWGAWGIVFPALGGLITCLNAGAEPKWYLIYAIGNMLAAGALALIKLWGREGIRSDALKSLAYGLVLFALMLAGRAAISVLLGSEKWQATALITPEIVALLFTEIIIWIARRLDGVFEDQQRYVARVQKEAQMERGEKYEG